MKSKEEIEKKMMDLGRIRSTGAYSLYLKGLMDALQWVLEDGKDDL